MGSRDEKDREGKEGEEENTEGLYSVHFLPPSFSFSFNFRPETHPLSPTVSIWFLCSAPLSGFLFVSSKPEQLQETAGGVLLGGGSSEEEAFSFTVVGNHSPNSTYELL